MSLNLYTYVTNNPLIYTDPTGHMGCPRTNAACADLMKRQHERTLPDLVSFLNFTSETGDALVPLYGVGIPIKEISVYLRGLLMGFKYFTKDAAITIEGIESVWKFTPFARGNMVEKALGGWLNNFPVIDKAGQIINGYRESVTSIKSLDLSLKSYQEGNSVYNTIMGYTKSLSNFTSTTSNGIVVNVNSSTQRILEIAIPNGGSSSQLTQISNATADAAKLGIQIVTKLFN